MKSKKSIFITVISLAILVALAVGCKNDVPEPVEFGMITISSDGSFAEEECKLRGLYEKAVMISSKYCGHCKTALPVFKEACEEVDIEPLILDVAEEEQRQRLLEFNISVKYTPIFIIDCEYFVGGKTKEEFVELLS